MTTALHPRPTETQLRGVARGHIQREMIHDLVHLPPGVHVHAWDGGQRAFDGMELRLRAALCERGWTLAPDEMFLVMVPFTPQDLRWHVRHWPQIRPSDAVLRHVLDPHADDTLDAATLAMIRKLLEHTWMPVECVVPAALGISAPS